MAKRTPSLIRGLALLLMLAAELSPAIANEAEDRLSAVMADHWTWWLGANPLEATKLGDHAHDDVLPDISLKARDASAATEQGLLDRLGAIPDASLSPERRTDKQVLAWMLSDDIAQNRFGERMMLFTTYASWHQSFADIADNLPFYSRADYGSYLKRLSLYPEYNAQAMAITARAVKEGYVQPCSVLGRFANTISGAVEAKPQDLRFYGPFRRPKPQDMSDAEWQAMQTRAVAVIRDKVVPEYRRFHAWFLSDYLPHCRQTDGASALPDGAKWYALQVRSHTTTDLTPQQIHQVGLDEVARILPLMDKVAKSAGYADRAAYIAHLRTDPRFYAPSPDALLNVAARQAKTIDGLLPRYFGKLPRLPYGVRPIPAETAEGTTTAYYGPGSPESGISGTYFVNTSKLDQRPLWELPALTAHEAVPGHHNQIALQQEMDLPPFRRYAAAFTAYTEGWGLYSEYLGEEMGLYDSPEKRMGRLSYDMWRACRLVVDTGIHAMGWNKARAVAFMRENSALSDANIDAEVNRYISWPGQALGYKLGELRIRALRQKAETALGPKFDLRRFHDAALSQGAVPLTVLEGRINGWIDAEKTR